MRASLLGALLALALASATPVGAATLVGDTINLNYLFPDSSTVFGSSSLSIASDPTSLSCSPGGLGVCSAFAENATFTVTSNSITLAEDGGSSYTPAAFNGLQYSNLGFGSGITGFSLSTDLAGLTASDVSFTGSSIEFNAQGLSFPDAYFVTLTLSSGVPEPSTWAMLVLGFAGLGFAGYRRAKARLVSFAAS